MDNIKDDNLRRLGVYIAEALIEIASETVRNDWVSDNTRDNIIGELARCITLQNLYLDREEFEKCAIMKLKIQDIKTMLNMENDLDLNIKEDDEE